MQPQQPSTQPQPPQATTDPPTAATTNPVSPSTSPAVPDTTSVISPSQPVPTPAIKPTIPPTTPVTPTANNHKPPRWYHNNLISYALVIVTAIVLALIINTFVLQSYVVVGTSMTPTLQDGNRLIVDKIPVTWHKIFGGSYQPERGNIIIFNAPIKITENGLPADQLIKRVIGLPGDHVVVKDGKITIYNTANPQGFNPDDKPYGKNLAATAGNVDLTVPDGYIFVCGDNRVPGGSFDSRTELGPIPIKNIVGKLSVRYMPLSEVNKF